MNYNDDFNVGDKVYFICMIPYPHRTVPMILKGIIKEKNVKLLDDYNVVTKYHIENDIMNADCTEVFRTKEDLLEALGKTCDE